MLETCAESGRTGTRDDRSLTSGHELDVEEMSIKPNPVAVMKATMSSYGSKLLLSSTYLNGIIITPYKFFCVTNHLADKNVVV